MEAVVHDAGKARLSHHGKVDPAKITKHEIDSLKRIIGELIIANDILKPWRKEEIERGQAYAAADEPQQDVKVRGRIKVRLVL